MMKLLTHYGLKTCLLLLLLPAYLRAQDEPAFVTYTTAHWDLSKEDGSEEEWLALAKEYHEKVTMKNEFIMRSAVLTHYFTADNSEVKLVTAYKSWEDMEKAVDRDEELIKAGWPDSVAAEAFFKKYESYMLNYHSDEIYSVVPGAKPIIQSTEPLVVFMQELQRAFPEDGSQKEFRALHKELLDNTVHKNPFIVGYRNYAHAWGADNRNFVEVRLYENWGAIESGFAKNEELVKAHWPNEADRKAFFAKYNKYFTGLHADYIYHSVPELRKG